jgi:integrase
MTRSRRAGVEDLWSKTVRDDDGNIKTVPSARHGKGSRWRARYVDDSGHEHSKAFGLKAQAQRWLDKQTADVVQGKHVAPRDARVTVQEWCDRWLSSYAAGHRANTVAGARTAVRMIVEEFGDQTLSSVRPSQVKEWCARLRTDGYAASTIELAHRRFKQVLADAVYDGLLGSNPCSRRTSPVAGKKKMYCCSTEQVWQLHDAMPERLRVAILLGAFVGLRIGEVCGLRVTDVDFTRGVVHPKQQYGGVALKNAASDAPVPIPQDLALLLSASVQKYPSDMMVTTERTGCCAPQVLARAVAYAKTEVEGLPEQFSFHDLRHFYASLLIGAGADVIKVQARLRHSSATTTLSTYAHLWPDSDESTNRAVSAALATLRVTG